MTTPPAQSPPANGSPSLLTDEELAALNPGIRNTVQTLRTWGFMTLDSGDGRTHEFECDRPYPYVVIRVDPANLVDESHRMMKLLEARSVRFDEPPHAQEDPEGWANYPRMEAVYLPLERMAIIDISNVVIPSGLFSGNPAEWDAADSENVRTLATADENQSNQGEAP